MVVSLEEKDVWMCGSSLPVLSDELLDEVDSLRARAWREGLLLLLLLVVVVVVVEEEVVVMVPPAE